MKLTEILDPRLSTIGSSRVMVMACLLCSRIDRLLASFLALALISTVGAHGAESGAGPSSDASTAAPMVQPPLLSPDASDARVTGLDADQVYAILIAEIAARRGDMVTAYTHYQQAAELTGDPRLAELAVRAALEFGDVATIEEGLLRWLAIDPSSVGAHQIGAFTRIKAGDREGALIHLMRILALQNLDQEAAFAHAVAIVSRAATPEERVELMQELVDQYPDNAFAQQSLANVAAAAAQTALAEAAAQRAMQLRPDWTKPRLFLVKLLISEDKRAQARDLLEEFLALSPEDQTLRMLYGQLLVEEEDFSNARDVFERLLRNRPKEPDVLFAVGILSLQLDDEDDARTYFTRLYETGQRRDEAAFYLGQAEERAGNAEVALSWYAKVEGTNAPDAQIRIALLRAQAGEITRAREIIQRLRDQGDENAVVYYLVETEILDSVGRTDDAMGVLDTALERLPDDETLLYARALIAVRLDRLSVAEQDLRRIIAADPEHADALNALGYTLADRTDRFAEAKELIEKAYALKPDEPAVLDSMGWVNYKLGHLELALDYLERALAMLDDGEIAAHLGEVLWALGRRDDAWAVWDAAIRTHPDHDYLNEVIHRHRAANQELRQ